MLIQALSPGWRAPLPRTAAASCVLLQPCWRAGGREGGKARGPGHTRHPRLNEGHATEEGAIRRSERAAQAGGGAFLWAAHSRPKKGRRARALSLMLCGVERARQRGKFCAVCAEHMQSSLFAMTMRHSPSHHHGIKGKRPGAPRILWLAGHES